MSDLWDVAVIGAGPAGAMAARSLAAEGARVALIDKNAFPRFKVCGCCLNADALATLNAAGLGSALAELGGEPLDQMIVVGEGQQATLGLPRGLAVSRAGLDHALVAAAVERGACLRERTTALGVEPTPAGYRLALRSDNARSTLIARTMLVADGLGGGFLRSMTGFRTQIEADSRIGMATVVPAPGDDYPAGTIHMAWGRAGYCGLVRIEQDQLALAAAVEPAFIRRCGGPGAAAAHLIADAGLPLPALDAARWKGTPQLSRRIEPRAVSGFYLTGDAAGYVEPFTGEGMAWALASGARFAAFAGGALAAGELPPPREWQRLQRRFLDPRQRRCRWITRALRQPMLARLALACAARWPALTGGLTRPVAARVHDPLH
ncbi:MAG: FAD-dependent oxidoreductase [Halofilum sp. (in: g-proteobacteria)]